MPLCANCGQDNPEGARFCSACGRPLEAAAPPREVRKVVTIVFSDVTGSTSLGERLDPESMRRVMARYFEEMKAALESHGGTVEKFIGDAVMAVFGIPVLHEDDALRAVRAALEMRERLDRLNEDLERDRGLSILTRTGINTGEVVAGDPASGQTLVTGDPVNVAARLEQAAQPGEILIGEGTHRLLRDAVDAERIAPLSLKGKGEPVAAFRLHQVRPGAEAVRRRIDSPMVGRDRQLSLLNQTFDAAAMDRACHLFTVIGSPGVGKSRLVQEFVAAISERATVLRGRCLPYGEGITYWPVAEMVKQAAVVTDDDAPDAASAKVAALLPGEEGGLVTERLIQAMGFTEAAAPAEELAWAFRKLLETLARIRPVVPVFDDIHWAEPTLLDLIDHVTDWSRDAPILLVSIARQELLDLRQGWGGGKRNATTIQLEPLTERATEPLRPEVGSHLMTLVRKEFIRPDHSDFARESAFRFRHILIRDAAYNGMPKETRARMHEAFSTWLERAAGERVAEYEEVLGYHLEQAYRYRVELGTVDDEARAMADRAARHLAVAGRRALNRSDFTAAVGLLGRSSELLPPDDPLGLELRVDLGQAFLDLGDFAKADPVLDVVTERAGAAG